jgi:hypothetical protein
MPGFSRASLLAAGFLLMVPWPVPAMGQVISPGKLSDAHTHLEGMGNCTQCHQLRTRGVDRDRCLGCHEPLARRVREGGGYHGALVEEDCGICHKEHLGKNFRVTHFDAQSFPHDSTGYTLSGSHGEAECRACHRPELIVSQEVMEFKGASGTLDRTFLGLGTECASCHGSDDPHGDQFGDRACATCHNEEAWEGAREFDHSGTAYPLEGRHRDVECEACHEREGGGGTVRYRAVEASDCSSCHEDPHQGRMSGPCSRCHGPEDWNRVRRARVEASFDHGGTRFPLEGAHSRAPCGSCHDAASNSPGVRLIFLRGEVGTKTYPRPRYDRCGSCHSDPHSGAFAETGCDDCHSGETWTPAKFGLALHDQESRFALTGAHRVTPCVACHQSGDDVGQALRFRLEGFENCRSCHREEDPHAGAFGNTRCETCHETASFLMENFDHDRDEVREWIQACTACHGATQPHGKQFPNRECRECHSTRTFRIQDFDHSRSRFLLDGAHQKLSCDQCHRREGGSQGGEGGFVRYHPLETTCEACHGAGE